MSSYNPQYDWAEGVYRAVERKEHRLTKTERVARKSIRNAKYHKAKKARMAKLRGGR